MGENKRNKKTKMINEKLIKTTHRKKTKKQHMCPPLAIAHPLALGQERKRWIGMSFFGKFKPLCASYWFSIFIKSKYRLKIKKPP